MHTSRLLLLVLASSLGSACMIGDDGTIVGRDSATFPEGIQRLVIDGAAGDVVIDGGADTVAASWVVRGSGNRVRTWVDGDTVHLEATCRRWHRCAVDWTVDVPDDIRVDIDTGAGDVDVAGIAGPHFSVRTGAGDITGEDLDVTDTEIDTGSGDVRLHFTSAPEHLVSETGSGDVDVTVPDGTYAVDLATGSGDETVDGLATDSDADHRLKLRSGSGDLRVSRS